MSDEAEAVPADADEQNEHPTLGARLRAAREARDLSVEKIADELRIEEHVLQALEDDRLADIKAAPVFIKGYIKQYGRLLRLDYEELREAFENQTNAEDVRLRPNRPIQLRNERQITIWIIAAIAVLLVGAALLLWWFGAEEIRIFNPLAETRERESAVEATDIDTREAAAPARVPVSVSVTARESEPVAAPPGALNSGPAEEVRLAPAPAVVDPPVEQARVEPAAIGVGSDTIVPDEPANDSGVATQGSGQPVAGDGAAVVVQLPVEPEPGSVPMSFSFADESWFELTDGRGRRLYYDLAEAGTELSFVPLPPARVLIGNADAVSITVASAAFAVPPRSRRGDVAIFVIDPQQD